MGKVLTVKVKEKGSQTGYEYKNTISLNDPNLICLMLEDLESMFNLPLDKVLYALNKKRVKSFPFSP